MTLASTTSKLLYNGDGSTTVFSVGFIFWRNGDIKAVHRDAGGTETAWVEGTHYTLTGGSGSTGTLTVETAPTDYTPAAGEKLLIKSALTETQDAALPLGGAFPSTTVEQMVDIVTRLVQQHSEEIARSILLPETASLSGLQLPEPGAAEFLRYNAAGTDLETVAVASLSLSALDTLITAIANGDTLEYDSAQAMWVNTASDFKVSVQATPDMTVRVAAGSLFRLDTKVGVAIAAQNTGIITAPATSNRIDFVYVDRLTGVVGVETGVESGSPVAPALTAGKLPVAGIVLTTATTAINGSGGVGGALLVDARQLNQLGDFGPEDIQHQTFTRFLDTGAADTYVITPVPAITAYANGQEFTFVTTNANTGASTLDINGLGALAIKKNKNGVISDLEVGDILSGIPVKVMKQGANLKMMSQPATAGRRILETEQATTSGSNKDFTGIPADAKKITIVLTGVSTAGTSPLIVQLGDAGGFEATGYSGTASAVQGAGAASTAMSTGFMLDPNPAAPATYVKHGAVTLSLASSSNNTWSISGNLGNSDIARTAFIGGTKSLSAVLTQIRLTTVGGTDAFDAGGVNIMVET